MTTTARERLFAKAEGRTKDVTLSTGDVVQVRPLKLTARTKLVKTCMTEPDADGNREVDNEKLIPHLVIASTFDKETGEQIFTVGDFETLEQMAAIEIDPLWEAAAALNGFAPEAVKAAVKP